MKFEHYKQPLLIFPLFIRRIIICFLFSLFFVMAIIFIGSMGFHFLEKWSWVDSVLNSILIMTGCGFNKILMFPATKIFASFYIIISSIIYFCILMMLFYPLMHRLMHKFHLEVDKRKTAEF